MIRCLPSSTLFPYTTLFRSCQVVRRSRPRLGRRGLPARGIQLFAEARAAPGEEQRRHAGGCRNGRSEEHTSELQSLTNLVCRLLLEKKKKIDYNSAT